METTSEHFEGSASAAFQSFFNHSFNGKSRFLSLFYSLSLFYALLLLSVIFKFFCHEEQR